MSNNYLREIFSTAIKANPNADASVLADKIMADLDDDAIRELLQLALIDLYHYLYHIMRRTVLRRSVEPSTQGGPQRADLPDLLDLKPHYPEVVGNKTYRDLTQADVLAIAERFYRAGQEYLNKGNQYQELAGVMKQKRARTVGDLDVDTVKWILFQ